HISGPTPCHESWTKHVIAKIFIVAVESTRVESINGILKKHLNRDYYGSNPSSDLPSIYNTFFKDIDSVLKDYLAPIPLSLQQYDAPQIQLQELLSDVLSNEMQVWKVFHITSTKSYYVVILRDSTLLFTFSNSEYHKPKGRPPKRLKSSIEEEATKPTCEQRTCTYCLN
ncbi:34345_t:CDS:2, partial [Gigaspora margarita]